MALRFLKLGLGEFFFATKRNEESTNTEISVPIKELQDIFAPLIDESLKEAPVSLQINEAIQRVYTIFASSKCDYDQNVTQFRDNLKAITICISQATENSEITIPVDTLEQLLESKIALDIAMKALNDLDPTSFNYQASASGSNIDANDVSVEDILNADKFDFFAAKPSLTAEEIAEMREQLEQLDQKLGTFFTKHEIQMPKTPTTRQHDSDTPVKTSDWDFL